MTFCFMGWNTHCDGAGIEGRGFTQIKTFHQSRNLAERVKGHQSFLLLYCKCSTYAARVAVSLALNCGALGLPIQPVVVVCRPLPLMGSPIVQNDDHHLGTYGVSFALRRSLTMYLFLCATGTGPLGGVEVELKHFDQMDPLDPHPVVREASLECHVCYQPLEPARDAHQIFGPTCRHNSKVRERVLLFLSFKEFCTFN